MKKRHTTKSSSRTKLSPGRRQAHRDSKALRTAAHKREQAAMTPEEIDELLVVAIIESVQARGAVTQQDLLATNVPPDSVSTRFKHCMAIAEEREPRLRHMMREAA